MYSQAQQDAIRSILRDTLSGTISEKVLAAPITEQIAIFKNQISSKRPDAPPFTIDLRHEQFPATEEQANLVAAHMDEQGLRYSTRPS